MGEVKLPLYSTDSPQECSIAHVFLACKSILRANYTRNTCAKHMTCVQKYTQKYTRKYMQILGN